jgi:hypothetical protein
MTNKFALNKMLMALLGSQEFVDRWWQSPNYAFEMKTPDDVYLSGLQGRREVTGYVLSHLE